jgi:hypothetical protein
MTIAAETRSQTLTRESWLVIDDVGWKEYEGSLELK